jgi:hypothetical protein
MLCGVVAIVDDRLRDRLTLDFHRAPAGCRHRSLPSRDGDQALLSHCGEQGLSTAFVLDRRDDGDRATSVGEDDFLTVSFAKTSRPALSRLASVDAANTV